MPLLERESELASIENALAAARAGNGSMLLIRGPAGIGKTALLDEARRRACGPVEAGTMRVLLARCTPLERDLAHGMVRQLLEPPVRAATPQRRSALLSGAAELARPVVLPEEAGAAPGPADADATSFADRRAPVVHGLYWLTANLAAERPMLLAVDDLQWSDPASLRYLAYLGLRLDGLPVAVIAGVRTGESDEGSESGGTLDELASGPATSILRPAPLTETGVDHLLDETLPYPHGSELAAACRAATGGVPFLLDALLSTLSKGSSSPSAASVSRVTSATVGHATLLRLSRLGAGAVPVARSVAVLGRHATPSRIARLTGLDEPVVVHAVDALAAAEILGVDRPIAFVHPIVRSSVYEQMPPGERATAHAAAATLLESAGEPPETVAVHLLATEPESVAGAVDTLRDAAAQAQARGAPESAVAYLRRCLSEVGRSPDRHRVLHELARAEAVVRDGQAIGHLEEAMRLAEGIRNDRAETSAAATAIAVDLVETLMFAGRWDEALTAVERALPESRAAGHESQDTGRLEVFRAGMMANDPRLIGAFEQELPRLESLAAQPGRAGTLMAALLASCAVCRGEPANLVTDLIDRGLHGTGVMAGPDADAWGPQVAASLAYLGEYDRAMAAADDMRIGARERGSVYGYVRSLALRALVEAQRGDLRAVEADVRSAFELSRANQLMFSVPPLLRWSVDALLERPPLADIAAAVDDVELDPVLAQSFSGGWLLETRGRLRAARGDSVGARTDLLAVGVTMTNLHVSNPVVSGWRSALALVIRDSDPATAADLVHAEIASATAAGSDRARGIAMRTAGLLIDGDERVERLGDALRTLRDADSPLESARTEFALGAAQRRLGRRTAAGEALRSALDGAHRCGADRLAARAEEELHALGARPRRRALSGPESLTPSEARVAAAANAGMTNREIAQALFVTSKTVENQLGRVYVKLGIRGRDELAAALSDGATPG